MTLPLEAQWLDAEGVAAMLAYEPRVVREKVTCLPDFPKPARIGGKGFPRWNAAEVQRWMLAQREISRDGRPRPPSSERSTAPAES